MALTFVSKTNTQKTPIKSGHVSARGRFNGNIAIRKGKARPAPFRGTINNTTTKGTTTTNNTNVNNNSAMSWAQGLSMAGSVFGMGMQGLAMANAFAGTGKTSGTGTKSGAGATGGTTGGSVAATVKAADEKIGNAKTQITSCVGNLGEGTNLASLKLGDVTVLKDLGLQVNDNDIQTIVDTIGGLKDLSPDKIIISDDGTITDGNNISDTLTNLGGKIDTLLNNVDTDITTLTEAKSSDNYKNDANFKQAVDKALSKMEKLKTQLGTIKGKVETAKKEYEQKCQELKDAQAAKKEVIDRQNKATRQLLNDVNALKGVKAGSNTTPEIRASFNKRLQAYVNQYNQLKIDSPLLSQEAKNNLDKISNMLEEIDGFGSTIEDSKTTTNAVGKDNTVKLKEMTGAIGSGTKDAPRTIDSDDFNNWHVAIGETINVNGENFTKTAAASYRDSTGKLYTADQVKNYKAPVSGQPQQPPQPQSTVITLDGSQDLTPLPENIV